MKRVRLNRVPCPVARTMDIVGEWWTLLILRECFNGVTRFDEFQKNLGISKNTLTARLAKLVKRGVLRHVPVTPGARRKHYKLSEMGKELYVVFVAIRQWGDKWTFDGKQPPFAVVERESGRPVAPIEVRNVDGRVLKPRDTWLVAV